MEFISSVIRWFCRLGDEEDEQTEGKRVSFLGDDDDDAPRSRSSLLSQGLKDVLISPTCLRIHRHSISTDALYDVDQNVSGFDSSSSDSLQQEAFISSACFLSHHQDSILDGGTTQQDQISVAKVVVTEERWIKHYSSSQKILLVGEGDFSFSASLADAFVSAPNIIATSLNSRGFLMKNYGRALSNIKNLENRGSRVTHGVDATEMASNPLLRGMAFDCIVFNFPHAGFFHKESRDSQLSRHQQLVSLFLKNAKEMINETGEIHITHKTNYGFHRKWEIERLASSQGLELIEAVSFDIKSYPGYCTKYGFGGDKDFDCNPSKTYKFGLQSASTKRKKKKKKKNKTTSDCKMI